MHAGLGLILVRFDALPEEVSGRCFTLPIARAELLEQGLSFERATSVRDVGLDANAGAHKIGQDSTQEGAEVSQKERPHQGDTEPIEVQTPDNEVVQNRDPASRGFWARWDGHVPKFYPAQKDYGCRLMWEKGQDCMHHYNPAFSFW